MTTFDSSNRPGSPPGRRRGLLAIAIAILALLVAGGSAAFSWRAVDQANDARDIALTRANGQAGSVPVPGAPTVDPTVPAVPDPTDPPTPNADGSTSSPDAPVLDERTRYEPKYTKEPLRIQAKCGATTYLDLDEPRVQVNPEVSELSYSEPCSPESGHLNLSEGVQGSEVPSDRVTPAECVDRIRASPIGEAADLAIRKGRVFCIETSLGAARASADTWKMIVLEVSAVSQDGTVSIEATAWNIPS